MIASVLYFLSAVLVGTAIGNLIGNVIGFLVVPLPRRDYPWNWRVLVGQALYRSWLDRQP